jgi:TPR repeat protein
MRAHFAVSLVLAAACSRGRSTPENQPAPSASVITLGVELGGCTDVDACERECDAGSADRCRRLAITYAFGTAGVKKDETKATALYEHACSMNDPSACVFAGQMHEFARGVAKDDAKAAKAYERACDVGWAPGCYNLAIMTERGTGVSADAHRAIELYKAACAAGAKQACESAARLKSEAPALPFLDGGLR